MIGRLGRLISVGLCGLSLALPRWAVADADVNSAWLARVWQTDEGLPENSVLDIAQTSDGYLWVATETALAKFDGVRFKKVPVPLPETPDWTHPALNRMVLVDGKEFWLAFEGGGVASLTPTRTNLFAPARGTARLKPVSMAATADRSVWVSYTDGSVSRVVGGKLERLSGNQGPPGFSMSWVASDAKGQLWFARGRSVGVYRDGRFEVLHTLSGTVRIAQARGGGVWAWCGTAFYRLEEGREAVKLDELPENPAQDLPIAMYEDRTGAVWIGMQASGTFRYDGRKLTQVPPSYSGIRSITDDREGNVWIGSSGGGLYRLRPRVVALLGPESGVLGTVQTLCEDQAGTIWAATQGGLIRRHNDVWEPVINSEIKKGNRCLTTDADGSVWLSAAGGLYQWNDGELRFRRYPSKVTHINTRVLLADRAGNIWVGLEPPLCLRRSSSGKWTMLPLPPDSREIRAMAEDASGKVWMGTENGFLFSSNGDELVDQTPREVTRAEPIRALLAHPDGSVWLGFAGSGVGRVQGGRFTRVRPEQGLYNGNISAIAEGGGAFWFGSSRGIFQVNDRELNDVAAGKSTRVQSIVYGQDEGLPSLESSYDYAPRVVRSRDGLIYFGMRRGLIVAHPERIQTNSVPPLVLLEQVTIDGQPIAFSGGTAQWELPPDHHRLEIEFTAPSCVGPENILFRHRLEGLDENWSAPDTQRSVSYSRLPAGNYRFRVSACNNVGVWSELKEPFSFRVAPFFWQTWWFITAVAVGLVGVVTATVRHLEKRKIREQIRRLEQARAVEQERARIAKDIHDELGAGLTQIGLAADLGANERMDSAQAQHNFSRIGSRATEAVSALDEIVWAINPRNDNLASLADYLCQVAGDCFDSGPMRCRKDVPTGLAPVPIRAEVRHNLALAVKEALTNALKHSGARTVWLRLRWTSPELVVAVEDDGVGFEPGAAPASGNGLRNQAARMQDIGGSVDVQTGPGMGTRITFQVHLDVTHPVSPTADAGSFASLNVVERK